MKNIKKLLLLSAISVLGLSSVGLNTVMAEGSDTTEARVEFTNEKGILEFIEVPKTFTFEKRELISTVGENIKTPSSEISIKLSDFSPASKGWDLTAKLSPFRLEGETDTTKTTLDGAYIEFSELGFSSLNSAVKATEPTLVETEVELSTNETPLPIAFAKRTEASDQGIGPWGLTGEVNLFIPPLVQSVGVHTATITWDLKAAP